MLASSIRTPHVDWFAMSPALTLLGASAACLMIAVLFRPRARRYLSAWVTGGAMGCPAGDTAFGASSSTAEAIVPVNPNEFTSARRIAITAGRFMPRAKMVARPVAVRPSRRQPRDQRK